MGRNTKSRVGSILAGAVVMAGAMSPGTVMASTQNHNNKPYITNQVTEFMIQEIDETNGTITVVVSENRLTEGSREKVTDGGEIEKIVDISGWTYRQLNVMTAAGVSDGDLYILTSGYGLGPTIFNQTYESVDIAKDTPTVLSETEVGALRVSEEKELVYSLGVSYYYAETGRNRTWYIPGRINYSSCFEGIEDTTGVVCEAETYEDDNGMLMVRYKAKEGTVNIGGGGDTGDDTGSSVEDEGDTGESGNASSNSDGEGDSSGSEGGENGSEGSNEGEEGCETGDVGDGSGENNELENEAGDSNNADENIKVVTVVKEVPVIQEVVKTVEKKVPVEVKTVETVVKTAVQEVPVTRTLVREVAGRTVYVESSNSRDVVVDEVAKENDTIKSDDGIKKDVIKDSAVDAIVGATEETEVPTLGEVEVKSDWLLPFIIGLVSGGTGMGVGWWIMGRKDHAEG